MAYSVLPAFGLEVQSARCEQFGSGLINHTWKVTTRDQVYILQRVNHQVFVRPEHIAHNISLIAGYLKRHHPEYTFVAPLASLAGDELVYRQDEGFFRLFPFMNGSHSIDVVDRPDQAYEAARQFGRFTRLLSGIDAHSLRITIPAFHDLGLRYRQFRAALNEGDPLRIHTCAPEIRQLQERLDIVETYARIQSDPAFRIRVTHHDTKISNVLFDASGHGLCVIDLDTVMPGHFISDLGDMMRTYLSPASEEEADLQKVEVREDIYHGIVQGYFEEMGEELTSSERAAVFYSGEFMIYMQALRFLTDHLNGDVYYGARYDGHNLVRARNQLALLQQLSEKKEVLVG